MIYELRTYDAFPGKLPALNARFANVTLGFFEKYNMKVVGFWTNNVGENTTNRLIYMLAFDDMAHRERAWKAFGSDPEWQKMRLMPGYADPDIVSNITNFIVSPLPFSAIRCMEPGGAPSHHRVVGRVSEIDVASSLHTG